MKKILITGGNGNIAKIIKNNLSNKYNLYTPSHSELDILDYDNLKKYIEYINPNIIIHTAIIGGRRIKEENSDVFYKNIIMFENILKLNFSGMIINLDSAAIYDRKKNILNRKEYELNTIPLDYYGFSKYVIYQRTLQFNNIYNFRIFNIFHTFEENDRFIKACFIAKKNNTEFIINEDKYFDFVYEDDFIKILDYYLEKYNKKNLNKTLNICYEKKYKLSDIVKIIENVGKYKKINYKVNSINLNNNYCGDNRILNNIKEIKLDGIEKSLEKYNNKLN